jgi:hypothetical protein
MTDETIYANHNNQEEEPIALAAGILLGHLTMVVFAILLILMAYVLIMPLSSMLSLTGNSFDNAIFWILAGCVAMFMAKSVISILNK